MVLLCFPTEILILVLNGKIAFEIKLKNRLR